MILSVIIVNYNVKYFLEQCLYSVEKALLQGVAEGTGGEPAAEIIVVDNNSSDGSLAYLQPRFPRVRFIANEDNVGFGRANNQALKVAGGKYILFLNPDTILPEDYCKTCLSFIAAHPGSGALGIRMVDGSGRFLKESRRGFPSSWVAFCKMTGLTALFPRSRVFAEYYLGYLFPWKDHPAPILSGACMWVSREILDKTGGFDEQFFMYAEDIDLSYRIQQEGYVNFYLAGTTILHFKGESTRKDIRYIRLFYKAMSQFRRKYARSIRWPLLNILMDGAIFGRAGIAALAGWIKVRKEKRIQPGKDNVRDDGNGDPGSEVLRTRLIGDPDGTARLETFLAADPQRKLVPEGWTADELIVCEGPAFSFKECIGVIEETGLQLSCKIHAAGSGSAAGSHSKEERGQTIVL
ncbi:MAG: glycosyltransferase family 2 protein [Bacteroidota bacterium]